MTSRNMYAELGVRPFLNAAGTYTALSGSRMPPEVLAAMDAAARQFVHIDQLQDAVGARIAELLRCEAALVTSGAAGAMTLAAAACITRGDAAAIARIPDVTGLKHEVVMQRAHRMGFDHAIRAAGARLVLVETAAEMQAALGDGTAMAFFANWLAPEGRIGHEEFLAIAHRQGVPALIDASADVPPVDNLWAFTRMGFDLAAYSGGKGLRGPQSTGLLLGRADLIAAARANGSPHEDTIGRGMKVSKEDLAGILAALELFLARDHEADRREYERRAREIGEAAVQAAAGVRYEVFTPAVANHVPHLRIQWDAARLGVTPPEVKERLARGDPAIEVNPDTNGEELVIGVWMLEPGESAVVARRVTEELRRGGRAED